MDRTKLLEATQRTLATRQAALKDTLEEIELLEAAGAPPQAIQAARVKRNRQHAACEASQQLIAVLTSSAKKGR